MMSPERWRRLRDLFDAASALDGDDRVAFLERECAGDAEMRARLESLLASAGSADRFFPPTASLDPTADPIAEGPGSIAANGVVVGPFRLLHRLGEGAFSVVYLAEQEAPIRRRVALKLLRHDLRSGDTLARFEVERQALALVAHPNVATIHDAGTALDGRPWVAMEYVDGPPITEYADERRLSLSGRLALFIPLCEAVQHAHQKGVIHRDLKPSNVLVAQADGNPLVKVIDFGVAKALGAHLTERTLHTEHGMLVGTPEYMSPEQAGGASDAPDTRSDVYSLGAILHELVVGCPPFDRRPSADLFDVLRRIREESPPRLTARLHAAGAGAEEVARRRRTDGASLARALRGDVQWIVLRCLEKEPGRRYPSAAALSEDVARFLDGHPILARPPSAGYQLRKLAARHKAITVLACVLALVVVGFAGAMSVMFAQQRAERLKSDRVSAFLEQMLAAADPTVARGTDPLVRDVLDDAARKVATELADEPATQAALERTLARTYTGLGHYAEAESLARRSVAAFERAHGGRRNPETSEARALLGDVLFHRGMYDDAEAVLRQALSEQEAGLDRNDVAIARTRSRLGDVLQRAGKYDEAERLLREALRIRGGGEGPEAELRAATLVSLGTVLKALGRFPESEAVLRESLDIQRRTLAENDPDITASLNELAVVLRQQGKLDEAESLYREALAFDERIFGHEHPLTAQLMSNLGVLLKSRQRYAEAESLYTEALRIRRLTLGDEHPGVGTMLNNLSALYREQGRFADAERVARECLAIQRKAHGEEHVAVALALYTLAGALSEMGTEHLPEAAELARHSLVMRRRLLGEGHPDVAAAANRLGSILISRDRRSEAEPLLRSALEIRKGAYAPGDWRTAATGCLLAECLLADRSFAEAESLLATGVPVTLGSEATLVEQKRRAIRTMIALCDSLRRPQEATVWTARLEALPAQ